MTDRLSKLKTLLQEKNLDAALVSSVADIIYLTDFAYFSTHEREAFLLITRNNQYILTDGRYSHAVRKDIKNFELLEISSDHSFVDWIKEIIQNEDIKKLGVESTNLTLHEAKKLEPLAELKHFDLSSLRMIKDPEEIAHIKKACELGDEAFSFILGQIKAGMTEKEVAYELENFIRKHGAEPSFTTIIAFEENAAIPHHKTGNTKLKTGNLILIDFGVKYENYCSDMTRTICLGKASEEKRKIHQTVLDAQEKAIESFHSFPSPLTGPDVGGRLLDRGGQGQGEGEKAASLDNTARNHILSKNFPSIPHSLGHGIGLEVHESPSLSPNSKDTLTEGMVFSIEPGIYLNNNYGVRIEDLFAIEGGKLIQLTNAPKELVEI